MSTIAQLLWFFLTYNAKVPLRWLRIEHCEAIRKTCHMPTFRYLSAVDEYFGHSLKPRFGIHFDAAVT
jgi:hypothetical protein